MHIAVLGAGAMGSWFGGLLAMQKNQVQLITTNQAHRDAIAERGLMLKAPGEEHTVTVNAVAPDQAKANIDLILILTKAFQTKDAMASIASLINDNTHVLSLQNGLGNAEAIASQVPLDRVWIGVSMMPVDKAAPGIVTSKGRGSSYFGNAANDNHQPVAQQILHSFTEANIELHLDAKIHSRVWEKVAFNSGMNALAALSHGRPGSIEKSPGAKQLAQRAADEVALVAKSQQVDVDQKKVYEMIELSCTKHADHIPSMLQDLLSRRRTEVDAINGSIAQIGKAAGIATPINDTLTTLMRLAELSHQQYD